ncbi:MAG: carbohydrate ABC transporter permease [Lachnospiraceae bacterium]|jgi:N-acetylglucosamine transport system permease protein|nr:carbohydrate ABC transporter permease [Lachnospiraceae bacterium]
MALFGKKKEKKQMEPFNLKKELHLLPGYIFLVIWVVFTFVLIGWIVAASFSTSREIFRGDTLKFASGFHWENYATAWTIQNVSTYFMNSLLYSTVSCILLILICSPAAYVLARFTFIGNKPIKSGFVMAMSLPAIMIILPLLNITTKMHLNGTRFLLIFLYVAINIPYTTTFLINFFATLSRSYEEAAAIDGCSPIKTFWKIMFPLAQPGIITVTIFNFLAVWNEYFMSLVFASTDSKRSVGVGLFTIISAMKQNGDYGALFAAVIIVFLPTFLLYIFLSEKIIAGVTGGGVKG